VSNTKGQKSKIKYQKFFNKDQMSKINDLAFSQIICQKSDDEDHGSKIKYQRYFIEGQKSNNFYQKSEI
jgi:hypothetical protein